jgi:3-hydroxyacyl-CoA dehydrogenase
MGSRIACHFAGIGVPVLLLDMIPKGAEESTKPADRNKLVMTHLPRSSQK